MNLFILYHWISLGILWVPLTSGSNELEADPQGYLMFCPCMGMSIASVVILLLTFINVGNQ